MLPTDKTPSCPECLTGAPIGRRDFIRVLGTTAAVAAVGGLTPLQRATAASGQLTLRPQVHDRAEAEKAEVCDILDRQFVQGIGPVQPTPPGQPAPAARIAPQITEIE